MVLDEPTSALDPHHEQVIAETLRRLKGSRTLILVTHRLESVLDCDRVYVLDAGRIVEQTTPGELLKDVSQRPHGAGAGGPSEAAA